MDVPPQVLAAYVDNLERRVADAEATGRAAVRALWQTHVWKHGGDAAFAERCDSPLCQDITAVLATDTARAWREDGE